MCHVSSSTDNDRGNIPCSAATRAAPQVQIGPTASGSVKGDMEAHSTGQIVKQTGPISFQVHMEEQLVWRRHQDHHRKQFVAEMEGDQTQWRKYSNRVLARPGGLRVLPPRKNHPTQLRMWNCLVSLTLDTLSPRMSQELGRPQTDGRLYSNLSSIFGCKGREV